MRAQLTLAAVLIVAFAGLSGCMGAGKDNTDTPVDQTSLTGGGTTTGTGTTPPIKVLSALAATVTIDAPAWVASGTEVPVSLSAPSNAKGALSYTWAIGALPGTTTVTAAKADTGSAGKDYIQAGASKTITYSTSGIYRMHCHPHQWMRHNVTVIDGYAGPKAVEILIVDGASQGEYRYVPENIVVGKDTVVTYKNAGSQPHTATSLGTQEPALKKLPLSADKGSVKVDGTGWQRIVAVFTDSEGRLGIAEKSIYTSATLPTFASQDLAFEFAAASPAPLAGTPGETQPQTFPITLEQGGLVTINYTASDPLAATPAGSQAQVTIHLTKDGETQDTLTSGPDAAGSASGKAQAGQYTLRVDAVQGAQITGNVVIEVVYELVPPPPTAAAAPADGHGGHAH